MLQSRWLAVLGVAGFFTLTFALLGQLRTAVFPVSDNDQTQIRITTPSGSMIDATDRAARRAAPPPPGLVAVRRADRQLPQARAPDRDDLRGNDGGMAPAALSLVAGDPSFRQPMGIVVIGGLVTSTLLSLVVIPVAYSLVDDFLALLRRMVRRGGDTQPRKPSR